VPPEFVATHRYSHPFAPYGMSERFRVVVVAPGMSVYPDPLLTCHFTDVAPVTVTVNVADPPSGASSF